MWAPLPTGRELAAAIEDRSIYRIEAFRKYGTLFVSNSGVSEFRKCETKAALTTLGYRGREDSIRMRLGSDAHAGIAGYRKGASAAVAIEMVRQAYEAWSGEALAKLEPEFAERMVPIYGWENVSRVLGVYLKDHAPRYPFHFTPALVEVPFAVPFDLACAVCGYDAEQVVHHGVGHGDADAHEYRPRVMLCGKVDAIVHDDTGAWYIDDVKTTGRLDSDFARGFTMDSQFSHYSWAVPRAGLGVDAIAGSVVTGIEWSRMPVVKLTAKGVAQKCRNPEHGVPVDECHDLHCKTKIVGPFVRSATTLDDWHRDVEAIVARMVDVYRRIDGPDNIARVCGKQGTFVRECPFCPAFDWCEGDRIGKYVDSVLRFEPWSGGEA